MSTTAVPTATIPVASRVHGFSYAIRNIVAGAKKVEARRIIRACLVQEPENTQLLFSSAVLSACMSEKEEALHLLDRIESVQPSFPDLARWRAVWSSRASGLPPAQSQAG